MLIAQSVLIDRKPVKILEYNELGALIGEYKGIYNYRDGTVKLIPVYNPFVVRTTPLRLRIVSEYEVRRQKNGN